MSEASSRKRQAETEAARTSAQQAAVAELMRVSPIADELGERFAHAGHDLALVGGSVRDALLGRLSNDLDFATSARPDEVLRIARPWADNQWETGIAFGTVGLLKNGLRLEVTTYRFETYDPESRKPEVTYGDSLVEDLRRRDFTVNAMAVSVPDHVFHDPFNGATDLAANLLRTPGRPEDSFSDDPLRMLRAARFAAQLGFDVDPSVVAAMSAMADRILKISAERIRDELSKLMLSPDPRRGLELLVATGLADRVLPELPKLRLETDEHFRHKDVYEHTLTVVEQAMALESGQPDLVLRLAALLHDVGKPATRRKEPGGRVSFHHHEAVGAKIAKARLTALKYPKDVIADVARLVELHLRFHGYGAGEWTDSAVRRYVRDAGPMLDRLHKLTRSDCTTRNQKRAAALAAAYDELEHRIEALRQQEEVDAIRPELNGVEIGEVLGIEPGPDVGRAYRFLLELRLDRGPIGKDAAAAALREWAREHGVGSGGG
ncbi:MAG: poly(A) polymerase [Actinomycetota bacterium]|nr:poly(A) polymerase [Actinomycetota bacterium]